MHLTFFILIILEPVFFIVVEQHEVPKQKCTFQPSKKPPSVWKNFLKLCILKIYFKNFTEKNYGHMESFSDKDTKPLITTVSIHYKYCLKLSMFIFCEEIWCVKNEVCSIFRGYFFYLSKINGTGYLSRINNIKSYLNSQNEWK